MASAGDGQNDVVVGNGINQEAEVILVADDADLDDEEESRDDGDTDSTSIVQCIERRTFINHEKHLLSLPIRTLLQSTHDRYLSSPKPMSFMIIDKIGDSYNLVGSFEFKTARNLKLSKIVSCIAKHAKLKRSLSLIDLFIMDEPEDFESVLTSWKSFNENILPREMVAEWHALRTLWPGRHCKATILLDGWQCRIAIEKEWMFRNFHQKPPRRLTSPSHTECVSVVLLNEPMLVRSEDGEELLCYTLRDGQRTVPLRRITKWKDFKHEVRLRFCDEGIQISDIDIGNLQNNLEDSERWQRMTREEQWAYMLAHGKKNRPAFSIIYLRYLPKKSTIRVYLRNKSTRFSLRQVTVRSEADTLVALTPDLGYSSAQLKRGTLYLPPAGRS